MKQNDKNVSTNTAAGKPGGRKSYIFDDSWRYEEPSMDSITSKTAPMSHTSPEMEEEMKGFRSDSRVRLLRDTTLMLLLLATTFVTLTVYFGQTASEQEEFEETFQDQASELGHALQSQMEQKLLALEAFAVSIKSFARSQQSEWPNITIPDFAERASTTLRASKGISLALHPAVKAEDVPQWEAYSVQHQSWLQESLNFQSSQRNASRISQLVYRVKQGVPIMAVNDSTTTRLLPLWEHYPAEDELSPVNYDAMADRLHRFALEEVLDNRVAVLGQAFDLSQSFHGLAVDFLKDDFYSLEWSEVWNNNAAANITDSTGTQTTPPLRDEERNLRTKGYDRTKPDAVVLQDDLDPPENKLQPLPDTRMRHYDKDGPAVNIWYPVFSDSTENHTVVAVVSLTTTLVSFFNSTGPPPSNGLMLVITNGCKQTVTFESVDGKAIYLGPNDYHDPDFEQYKQRFILAAEEPSLSQNFCPYRAYVYPSTRMRQEYAATQTPFFSILIATVFIFTIMVFLAYDYLIHRHQRNLADKATRTTAIVSSLFPKIVRDRLFEEQANATTSPLPKTRKQFSSRPASSANLPESNSQLSVYKHSTIADLFPNTTVMFGDLAGFTAWSSSRQPSEVFMLLETLYGALDGIARAMNVFKVETIGDCYMAVTGLPTPQQDHHLRMVRFARYALQKVSVVTKEMESSLGPDTANLGFRVGLHSGPVTAGVLRGEKSRFQLFGDTVNTASRMESTGSPNQIQISQTTADLLIASGKAHWMKKREELVEAKGKGKVQTYWIKSSVTSASKSSDDGESIALETASNPSLSPKQHKTKTKSSVRQSLIDWQVELLSKVLKQIELHRKLHQRQETKPFRCIEKTPTKSIPRNNIAEKISMPEFDPVQEDDGSATVESIELSSAVLKQLEDLIATYAELYRENCFHNFDHACHVTMSANKLLQRIVFRPNVESKFSREAHDYTFGLTSDPLTQFAILFSAVVHDLDHSGVSNQQLAKENGRLAIMYGGKSVAEQNSIDLAFEVLSSPSYADLVSCICADENEYLRFKQLVVNCVMATDIFDKDLVSLRNSRWKKAFSSEDESASDLKATIVIEHIIQAADVAHTMQHWHVYYKWNEKLFAEMCAAYQSGRGVENDPASTWYEGELWFFDNYVIPLAKKLDECGVFGVSSDECLNYALENRNEWKTKGKEVVEEFSRKYSAAANR